MTITSVAKHPIIKLDELKYSAGNSKLGTKCFVVSRPVGMTCPTKCHFLGRGCYAEATEKRFPNARRSAMSNVSVDWWQVRQLLILARRKGFSIRFHERGDWGIDNKIDKAYVQAVKRACQSLIQDGMKLPEIWTYTHFLSSYLVKHLSPYMNIYASVHSLKEQTRAEKAGFKHFAWIDTDGLIAKHKNGGNDEAPKLVILNNERYVVCPEMRKGRDNITCSGSKNTKTCDLCVRGLANVVFLEH
jgi:hypothetical protein